MGDRKWGRGRAETHALVLWSDVPLSPLQCDTSGLFKMIKDGLAFLFKINAFVVFNTSMSNTLKILTEPYSKYNECCKLEYQCTSDKKIYPCNALFLVFLLTSCRK